MDNISNMLVSIKNAQNAKKQEVLIPYSKIKMAIAEILAKEGFVKEVSVKAKKARKFIEIGLVYENEIPKISHMARISKLSKRAYLPAKKIRPTRRGLGITIFSTPKGVLTDKEAKKQNVGGEIICQVW